MTLEEELPDNSLIKVKRSFVVMFVYGLIITACAITLAHLINKYHPLTCFQASLLEYGGYICWAATLGMLGGEIQTWSGRSKAEILNQTLSKVFSLVGIFLFVMSRELEYI